MFSQTFYKYDYEKFHVSKLPVYFVFPRTNPEELEEFEALVGNYWLNDNYQIITEERAEEIKKSKEKVVVATFQNVAYYNADYGVKTAIGTSVNRFVLLYNNKVFLEIFVEQNITHSDVVYVLNQSSFILKNYTKFKKSYIWKESAKLYGKQLRGKTLLIIDSYLEKITEAEVKNVYPFKYEIVSREVFDQKVKEGCEDCLGINYGDYLFTDCTTASFKIVYSIKDGTIVSYSMPKATVGNFSSKHSLKKNDFERIVKTAGY